MMLRTVAAAPVNRANAQHTMAAIVTPRSNFGVPKDIWFKSLLTGGMVRVEFDKRA